MAFKDTIIKINQRLAIFTTKNMSTMACVYLFICLSMLPLAFSSWQADILYVSNCIQLVALPIIMVGQALMGKNTEDRAEQDHTVILAEFEELKKMHKEIHKLLKENKSDI